MSKRRRASSVSLASSRGEAEGEGEGEEDSDAELQPAHAPGPGRKRRRVDPGDLCQQLYDTIRSFKKQDGTLLCNAFIRAPKRRQEPHYYELVSQPIDLLQVQQKLKTDTYEDMEELAADIELLVNNAKAFYKPDTSEYKDANMLWKLFTQSKQALENGEELRNIKLSRGSSRKSDNTEGELSETSTNYDDDNLLEELFASVMSASADNRPLYTAFQFLPSKRRYPEYYEVIDTPIDLKMIACKIQAGDYSTLNQLEKDLLLMVRNACEFNEPGSQIYKDAKTLKKIIQTRKQELDAHGRGGPSKTSERIRSKRCSKVGQTLSSATIAIVEPPDTDEDNSQDEIMKHDSEEGEESEGEDKDKVDSPQWKLLECVKCMLGPNGSPMAEPFWRLPSRRFYPDYYKEIKNPVSLNQIRARVRRGDYGTLSELAGDLNIMFENAKKYNIATSKIYKDAVKLQRAMQQRVQELLDIAQSSSSDDESLSSVKSQVNTPRPRGRPRVNPLPPGSSPSPSTLAALPALPLKKKLHLLAKHLLELSCSDGRQLMVPFLEKPSKKAYPNYYNVIERPIDMLTIEANIKNDRYSSLEELVADFRLMFSNCRQYNEEHSAIYEDANLLEKAMGDKLRELGFNAAALPPDRKPLKTFKPRAKQLSSDQQKLRSLYDAIRDYRDAKTNRQLALIFMKLPSKNDYPDYYELIKRPIDMEKISQKLKSNGYSGVNELAMDFGTMFDNACKYNEPDSQLYKDALVLQKVCLQTKQLLKEDDDTVPDVQSAVQELLLTLFTTIYNHQDEEGRCYSDSMAELPEHDEGPAGEKTRGISLDLVKRRLDRGLYKRLDHFQEDMFAVFERARRLSRTDSQVFEDAVELQTYYIEQRDAMCAHTLDSPALLYTREMMQTGAELVRQCKMLQENTDDDDSRSGQDESVVLTGGAPLPHTQYNKGDFVYLQARKGEKDTTIVQIERVWTNPEGVPMLYGIVYFRPYETFHIRTRRFLEQEVFKTETHRTAPLEHVTGPCCVMNVKEYFKYRPEGFLDRDVYVCESRYSTKLRTFKKIKVWDAANDAVLVQRETPLEPNRSVSVFRERVEKHKDELAELEGLEQTSERPRPDVAMCSPPADQPGDRDNTYYEQYNTVCSGVIKTGDYVYVVTDGGKQMIAQVHTIWETTDNKSYFRGPFLIFPGEVAGAVNKPFYKQEVLLTTVHESSPVVGIVGKCSVLDYDQYLKCRLTEIAEQDVFVCDSLYDESVRVTRKLAAPLTKVTHSKEVTPDEVYYFPKQLSALPLATAQEIQSTGISFSQDNKFKTESPSVDLKQEFTNLINTTIGQDVEMMLENSMDDSSLQSPATPLSGGNSNSYNPAASYSTPAQQEKTTANPPTTGKKKKNEGKGKLVTGYILYSSEVRKAIASSNPESTFGEISRIVGVEWRSLSASSKQSWEERAARVNEETAKQLQEEARELGRPPPVMETVYECCWDSCDYQFEDLADTIDHCIGEGGNTGHVQQHYRNSAVTEYPCLWRSCLRVKRGQTPFPNLPRLLRHVRDLHINKGNGRQIATQDKSKNYVASTRNRTQKTYVQAGAARALMSPGVSLSQMSPVARNTPSPGQQAGQAQEGGATAQRGLDPLFVSVPPRPQRVQHSEAYIRYIEGLHSEQKYITPWEKSLAPASQTQLSYSLSNKLPGHWLSEECVSGYVNQDKSASESQMEQSTKVLKALCGLRDFMMRDALSIQRNLS